MRCCTFQPANECTMAGAAWESKGEATAALIRRATVVSIELVVETGTRSCKRLVWTYDRVGGYMVVKSNKEGRCRASAHTSIGGGRQLWLLMNPPWCAHCVRMARIGEVTVGEIDR